MQDRFKFRFWDKETQTMQKSPMIELRQRMTLDTIFNDDRVIFMQSTGLKDKNGKLIYEGDIVEYSCPAEYCSDGLHKCQECYDNEIGIVSYDEELALYECRSEICQCPLTDNINTEDDLEVIGNIYENPELLKEVE